MPSGTFTALRRILAVVPFLPILILTGPVGVAQPRAEPDRLIGRIDPAGLAVPEGVVAAMEKGVSTHMVYVEVDAIDFDPAGGEPVFAGERAIGVTSSGGFGHAIGKSLAFAYVDPGFETPGTELEISLLGERRSAKVLAAPAYDPENLRLRG